MLVVLEEANRLCSSQDPPGLCPNRNSQAPAKSLEMQRETPLKLGGGRAGHSRRDLHRKTGGGWVRVSSLSRRAEDREEEALSQGTDSEWEKELLRASLSKNQNRSSWRGRDMIPWCL